MDAVIAYGTPLVEDPERIGLVTALGLDEILFVRTGSWKRRSWVTSIVDVTRPAQLLDVVERRLGQVRLELGGELPPVQIQPTCH